MKRFLLFLIALFMISCNYYVIPDSEWSVSQLKIGNTVLSCRSDMFCCWPWRDDQKGIIICAKVDATYLDGASNSILVGPRIKY